MKPLNLQLKHLLTTSSFTLAVALFPLAGLALEVQDVPNPRQINGTWVTDMAGILDAPTQAKLNAEITKLEQKNGAEIAVVTVLETAPSASPKAFTTKLFNYWKIGKKGQNNGVLVLISKGERRVEIETGYGVESILPNATVGNIIDTQITPKFKQGDFNGRTLAGTKAVIIALENPSASNQPLAQINKHPPNPPLIRGDFRNERESQNLAPSPYQGEGKGGVNLIAIPPNPDATIAAQPLATSAPTQDGSLLWGLLVGGGLVSAIGITAFKNSRVSIEPEGRSRIKSNYSSSSSSTDYGGSSSSGGAGGSW